MTARAWLAWLRRQWDRLPADRREVVMEQAKRQFRRLLAEEERRERAKSNGRNVA